MRGSASGSAAVEQVYSNSFYYYKMVSKVSRKIIIRCVKPMDRTR